MSFIRDLKYRVLELANDNSKPLVEELFQILETQNRYNFKARVEVEQHDAEKIDLDGVSWTPDAYFNLDDENGEDRQVYRDQLDDEIARIKDVLQDREQDLEDLADAIRDLVEEEMPYFGFDFDIEDLELGHTDPDLEIIACDIDLEKRFEQADEALNELKQAERGRRETAYDEAIIGEGLIYRRMDTALARVAGFGCGTLDQEWNGHEAGTRFLFLTGCGQDMSPCYVAYEALRYGSVSPSLVKTLEDPKWCRNVLTDSVFDRVVEKLGIADCVETIEADAKAKMEAFEEQVARLRKMRQEGAPEELVQLGGLMALIAAQRS